MLKEYRTMWPYIKKYRLKYLVGFVFLVLVDLAQVLIPRYVSQAIDIISSGKFVMTDLTRPAVSMLLAAILISVGRFIWRYFIMGSSRRIEAEMRDDLFAHYMEMSPSFYQENKTGDLMAKATNDMNAVRQAMGMGFVTLIDGVFMTIMIITAMLTTNTRVALYTIIPLPLISLLIVEFGRLVGKQFKRVQEIYSKMSDIAQETVSGMRVVKAFVKEQHFSGKFSETNDDYSQAVMTLVKTYGFFFPLISFLAGVSNVILLGKGGNEVIRNAMSPGDIIAMISYLQMLIWPMMGAGFTVNIIQRGGASLKRLNEVFATKSDIVVPENPRTDRLWGGIDVVDLSYTYKGANRPALEHISFSIQGGQTLGVLGRVGSGKSTLLKLMPRLLDPGRGKIFVGGNDICLYELSALRRTFGFVPQDSFLFSASVKENILYGGVEVSAERFEALSKIAALDGDLKLFPDGWDTVVGERGLTLSGGQKQRIAIARALAINPEILIMDDSLSAVDAETEERILQNLLEERKGRTNVIVSHRVSTLRHADSIIVLDGGRITQSGTHQTLLAESDGFYAKIARLQELETQIAGSFADDGERENG
jgi:ATP-binding cassette subfamily B protein